MTHRRFRLVAPVALVATLLVVSEAPAFGQGLKTGFVLVANQQSANASLIDLSSDKAILIPVGTGPHEAILSPSGKIGVVTIYGTGPTIGNELAVIDVRTGVVVRKISLGEYTRPHGGNFIAGKDDRIAVTSEASQRVVLVDLVAGKVEAAIETGAAGSHMVALTADGKRGFTSNVGAGSVSEIDLEAKKLVRTIPIGPRVEGIAVTPDGSSVWAGSNTDGTVSVIDTRTGAVETTLTGFKLPYRLSISADGKTAIICDPQDNKIHVADVASRKVIWSLDGLGSPRGVNISPDGKTAFVTLAQDQAVGIVDLVARKMTRTIPVGSSPDGVWYGPAPR